MSEGQNLGDLSCPVNRDQHFTVSDGGVGRLRRFHHQQDIVRELGEDEHQHDRKDDAQRLVLLKVLGLQERANDDGVAEDHDQQREKEAHADLQGEGQDLSLVVGVFPKQHGADLPVVRSLHLSKDKLRQSQENGDGPDSQAGQFAVEEPFLLQVLGLGHLHDDDVAVYADAGEQEHAAEEVDPVNRVYHFAGAVAKVPAFVSIHGPEGQHAEEEEVGHRQVQQVHVRHCFQAVANGGVDPDHHQVAHGADDKDDPKERSFVLTTKLPGTGSVTHLWVFSWTCAIVKSVLKTEEG